MAFRFEDKEGDERMKRGLHPASGKPVKAYAKKKEMAKKMSGIKIEKKTKNNQ